jgi:hypothetical protein
MLKAIRKNALSSLFGIGNSFVCLITFSMSNYLIHMITNIKQANRTGASLSPEWAGDTGTRRDPGERASVRGFCFSSVILWRFLLATGALSLSLSLSLSLFPPPWEARHVEEKGYLKV